MFLMDAFKMTEYNPICKGFTEVFFNHQNFTFQSYNSFGQRKKGNLATVVVGSLSAWIDVVTIN